MIAPRFEQDNTTKRLLVALLRDEPSGLSCDSLASRLRRRRSTVLTELRSSGIFEHRGRGRGSRWFLTRGRVWDGSRERERLHSDATAFPSVSRPQIVSQPVTQGQVELAFFAGFFEGAGSFFVNRTGKGRALPVAKVTKARREIPQRLQAAFGGSVCAQKPRRGHLGLRELYEWRVSGRAAVGLMRELAPFLSEHRRSQIEAVLHAGGSRYQPEDRAAA